MMFTGLTRYNSIEWFGIIGCILLIVFTILMLPKIIRHFKSKRENNRAAGHSDDARKKWMDFLITEIRKQQNAIKDVDVNDGWSLLLQSIETIQKGYGNKNGVVTIEDIRKIASIIQGKKIWETESLGEGLFTVEVLPDNQLRLSLHSTRIDCSASLMLDELNSLIHQLGAYHTSDDSSYTIEIFRRELKSDSKMLNGVKVSDTSVMVYLNDETAFPVPVLIDFTNHASVAVITNKKALNFLLKENKEVWIFHSQTKTIEIHFQQNLPSVISVEAAFELLKNYSAV